MALQRQIFLLQKGIMKKLDNSISKILLLKKVNTGISALLRILLRFNAIFRRYYLIKEKVDIKSLNEFWMVRIGFFKKRNFLPYLNVDPYLVNKPHLCSDLINLPLKEHSCQEIYAKHFFHYFSMKNTEIVIKKWRKFLIPGGTLKIQIDFRKNKDNIEKLVEILEKNRFYVLNLEENDIRIDNTRASWPQAHATCISV